MFMAQVDVSDHCEAYELSHPADFNRQAYRDRSWWRWWRQFSWMERMMPLRYSSIAESANVDDNSRVPEYLVENPRKQARIMYMFELKSV